MKYFLLVGLQALVFPCQAAAEGIGVDTDAGPARGSFRQQVLAALGEQLLQTEPLDTRAFNRHLMGQTEIRPCREVF